MIAHIHYSFGSIKVVNLFHDLRVTQNCKQALQDPTCVLQWPFLPIDDPAYDHFYDQPRLRR